VRIHVLGLSLLVLGVAVGDEPTTAIRQLGAAKFADREAAERNLLKLAEAGAEPVLKACAQAYRQSTDPEVRHRLKDVLEQLVEKHLFRLPRGFLGVQINNVFIGEGGRLVVNGTDIPPRAVWVGNVVPDSGAAKAGMQANDVIIAVNGKVWEGDGPTGFTRHIQTHRPGTKLTLTVLRDNRTNELAATLGELPETERERLYAPSRAREFFEDWWKQNVGEELPATE
jgi:C-terminal processing protease CtpA/Prc